MKFSRKMKLTVASLLLISILIVFFSSHYIQLSLMEHISLKTFIGRTIAASQNLNVTSLMYGSFFNSSWFTLKAVDVLKVLGTLNSVDTEAILHFLIGPNQAGPADWPMHNKPKYNVEIAYLVVHTASAIDKLKKLPSALVEKIRETIVANQNSSSKTNTYWPGDRTFLFETARLMNETSYVNATFQKQEVLNDFVNEIGSEHFEVFNMLDYLRAIQELQWIESGYPYINEVIPGTTKKLAEFYILSLWDDSRYGFYESIPNSSPKYYEGSIAATYYAVSSYILLLGIWEPYENNLIYKIGYDFENVLTFLSKCQNRYGIFFDSPREVSNKVNSFPIPPFGRGSLVLFNAVMLLNNIVHMDFLEQTVRWPPNPTLIESISDRLGG